MTSSCCGRAASRSRSPSLPRQTGSVGSSTGCCGQKSRAGRAAFPNEGQPLVSGTSAPKGHEAARNDGLERTLHHRSCGLARGRGGRRNGGSLAGGDLLSLAGDDLPPLVAELLEDLLDLLDPLLRLVLDRNGAGAPPDHLLVLRIVKVDDQSAFGVGVGGGRGGCHRGRAPPAPAAVVPAVAHRGGAVHGLVLGGDVVRDVNVGVLGDLGEAALRELLLDEGLDALGHQRVGGGGLPGVGVLKRLHPAEVEVVGIVDADLLGEGRRGGED